jgi:signal transduction histidine kinase
VSLVSSKKLCYPLSKRPRLDSFAAIALEAHSAYASMEQAVEARTAALEQALAYRQTFISSISHELRTPLYSISGLCAVMQNATDVTAAQSENLGVIASSAEDLQRIVTAILDMAKLESGGMTAESIPFDLRDALESSLESVAHISRAKNIELVLENDVSTDPAGKILGDPHRLRQCLLNLLSNAVKFGRAGDRPAHIKVGWTVESTEEEGTEMITISVADNGIGIPKSKMNRLFHSFSQIDASITRQYGTSSLWSLPATLPTLRPSQAAPASASPSRAASPASSAATAGPNPPRAKARRFTSCSSPNANPL